MHKYKSVIVGFALVVCVANKPVMAAQLPCEAKLAQAAIPQNVFYLPASQAATLQQTLNRYGSVRLDPAGDYTKSPTIKLGSNQALYGLAGTKLPQVTVPAGTSNALLSGVSPVNITFYGATRPITGNCFNRISNSSIIANNVMLVNNLFTDLGNDSFVSDTSKQGYLQNNRFIRFMSEGPSPSINIIGNSAKQSFGNQFIWTNILGPGGDGIIIKNQKNVGFTGIDAESWNNRHIAVYPGMMNVLNTDFLSVFMSNGGDNQNKTGQYFNLDAKNIVLQGMSIGTTKNPGIILGVNVQNLLTIKALDIGIQVPNAATQVIDIWKQNSSSIAVNQQTIQPENLTTATKNTIAGLLQIEGSIYDTWQKPTFNSIPDPAGPNWQTNLSNQPDSSETIQALIDKNGIAVLNSGIYYIGKPLLLKAGQGIIGAGADKTAIIAKSPMIDLIAGATHFDVTTITTSFVLADLTLQGGFNGINHTASGSGQGADYNLSTLSHVTFRNMTNSGITMDNIYAWDNNYIDHVNFYRCNTGIKQRRGPPANGDHIGMTFLDKNVFYQNQFVENNIAIDWQPGRANNLDAFVNCLFKNNVLSNNIKSSNSPFFFNSVFETASTQPLISDNSDLTGFVNSYFVGKQAGNAIFNNCVYCNHCIFDNSAVNAGLVVASTGLNSYFVNNTLAKAVNQTLDTGLIANSNFSNTPKKPIVNSVLVNKTAHPF